MPIEVKIHKAFSACIGKCVDLKIQFIFVYGENCPDVITSVVCFYVCVEEDHEKVDEVHHWTNERYVAIALIPIIPAALAYPHPVLDTALVSAMCLHTHWLVNAIRIVRIAIFTSVLSYLHRFCAAATVGTVQGVILFSGLLYVSAVMN